MPLQGLHPRSRSVSIESPEQLGVLGLTGLRGICSRPTSFDGTPSRSLAVVNTSEGGGASGYALAPQSEDGRISNDESTSDLHKTSELHEMLNFNASIYDLTVQYSCTVAHSYGDRVGVSNLVMVLVLQILNLYMQFNILEEVEALIARPAMAHAQHLYRVFTEQCYGTDPENYIYSQEVELHFQAWEDDGKAELCAFPMTSPRFFLIILLIWTFFLFHELKQTAYFSYHLLKLDRPATGRVTFVEQSDQFVITHVGPFLKVWITFSVLLPKFGIAFLLWYIGARWLTATAGIDNLVLNSLALTFICELDELIFRTCVSETTKACLEKTKLPLPPQKYEPSIWGSVEMLGTVLGCVSLAFYYVFHLQDVIPNYRWDLKDLCRNAHVDAVMGTHVGHGGMR